MTTGTAPQCNPMFQAGTVTLALDAPQQSVSTQPLPNNFRSMSNLKITGNTASGSAQYSLSQLQAMISQKVVTTPLVVVDLRQEFHGFLNVNPALYGENEIAVGWFVERDWINVDKDLPSINAFEPTMLGNVSNSSPVVYQITSKTPTEDGICTATPFTVNTTTVKTEQALVQGLGYSYLRLPTTDHCPPRDYEVDQFVSFEAGLKPGTWLHFHCRAGDGRTTVFMAMHDIINNAPSSTLEEILTRQGPAPNGIGGIDLSKAPPSSDQVDFDYPFSQDRFSFMIRFYAYVEQAKPGKFELKWSDWISQL
jgi:inositol hexakisphosphate